MRILYHPFMIVTIPRLTMRAGPSIETKVVSEALFSEKVICIDVKNDWEKIQTPDGYSGWVQTGGIIQSDYKPNQEITRLSAHLYKTTDTEFGPILTLPFGSKLETLEQDDRWLKVILPDRGTAFIQRGDVEPESLDLMTLSKKFLGLPYTWGGRSSFGFDCSGFVQMLYSRMGLQLPRDSCQQVNRGQPVKELFMGDLIFWGHSEQEIRHVGMYLKEEQFIHTSVRENKPYLRISSLLDSEWCDFDRYSCRTARRIIDIKTANVR